MFKFLKERIKDFAFGKPCWKLRVRAIHAQRDYYCIEYKVRERLFWEHLTLPKISKFQPPEWDDANSIYAGDFNKCVEFAKSLKSFKDYLTLKEVELESYREEHQKRLSALKPIKSWESL